MHKVLQIKTHLGGESCFILNLPETEISVALFPNSTVNLKTFTTSSHSLETIPVDTFDFTSLKNYQRISFLLLCWCDWLNPLMLGDLLHLRQIKKRSLS